ncbi:MAG: hypothetical protein WBD40_05935, partial [Tepidisphaeraceae bacterium]
MSVSTDYRETLQSPFRKSPLSLTQPAAPAQCGPMPLNEPVGEEIAIHRFAEAYARHKVALFAIVAIFFLASFNGQWVLERDTSLFRGLGHALATGKGYVFGEFGTRMVYPGLPLMLAGLEIVFGETALPAILLMNAMAIGVLVLTYRLICLHYPAWVAVAVTVGVGLNACFLHLSQEIMTDIPFLLGVMLVLYGWERLRLATASRERWIGAAYLLPGLALAISTRPTFWILAMAWGLVCVYALIRGPRRAFYAISLIAITAVAITWFFVDPRTRGFNPLAGGYEHDFFTALHKVGSLARENLPDLIQRQFAAFFFGGRFGSVITPIVTLALIGSTYFLFKRGHALWGTLILMTLAVTLAIETVPRYYLMVLPLVMLAYVLMFNALATRAGPRWADAVFLAGVVMLMAPNTVRSIAFVYEQHWEDPGKRKKWAEAIVAAEMIKQHVPQGGKVIGPVGPILSYLSGRQVYMQRELLPSDKGPMHYPRYLARRTDIEYAIFKPGMYADHSEPAIGQMMERGVIVPTDRVARSDGITLARVKIVVPATDWRKNPVSKPQMVTTTRKAPTSAQARREHALKKQQSAEARARRERLAWR